MHHTISHVETQEGTRIPTIGEQIHGDRRKQSMEELTCG